MNYACSTMPRHGVLSWPWQGWKGWAPVLYNECKGAQVQSGSVNVSP